MTPPKLAPEDREIWIAAFVAVFCDWKTGTTKEDAAQCADACVTAIKAELEKRK